MYVSSQGFSELCKLENLQEFVFVSISTPEVNINWFLIILEFLPHLHIVGGRCDDKITYCLMLNVLGDAMGCVLSAVHCPLTLQLRLLVLNCLSSIPEHVLLPEVEVLFLFNFFDPRHLIPLTGRFTKLSKLIIYCMGPDELMRILGHFGRQLQTLRLNLVNQAVQLDKVLDACPNLSELELTCSGLKSASQLRPDTVRHVQILCIDVSEGCMQPGLLVQLLKLTPKLRSLKLFYTHLDEDNIQDLTELVELAQQQLILQRLQKIYFKMDANKKCTTKIDCRGCILSQVLYKLVVHCPRLQTMGHF